MMNGYMESAVGSAIQISGCSLSPVSGNIFINVLREYIVGVSIKYASDTSLEGIEIRQLTESRFKIILTCYNAGPKPTT